MLEGLDRVDWQHLTHAYGAAGDVPVLLRDLASPNAQTRDGALSDLYSNINHQGNIYQATAYAVPFLIELLEAESDVDKVEILMLLAHLAHGHSYWDVHQHLEFIKADFKEELATPAFQAKLSDELYWVDATHKAVRQGIPVYLALLSAEDPKTRSTAAYTLAALGANAPHVIATLRRQLGTDPEPLVSASILFALSVLDTAISDIRDTLQTFVESRNSEIFRLAAAMALVRIDHETTPLTAVNLLLDTIKNPTPLNQIYDELPWANKGLVADVSKYVVRLNYAHTHIGQVLPLLIAALDKESSWAAQDIAQVLLYLVFGERISVSASSPVTLADEQRQVLMAIAYSESIWGIGNNMSRILRSFGLPDRPDTLKTFLNSKGVAHERT